jgi:hypothetical protein
MVCTRHMGATMDGETKVRPLASAAQHSVAEAIKFIFESTPRNMENSSNGHRNLPRIDRWKSA